MAIRRKEEQKKNDCPEKLEKMVEEAASLSVIKKLYEESYNEKRDEVSNYLEHNDDDFEVDLGKGFRTSTALVCYKSKSGYEIDKAQIIEMIKGGHLTLETVLEISNINATKLKDCIGKDRFNKLATESSSEYLAITPNADFKERMIDVFKSTSKIETEPPKPIEITKPEPKPKKNLKESIESAEIAASQIKKSGKKVKIKEGSKITSETLETLEDILNEE